MSYSNKTPFSKSGTCEHVGKVVNVSGLRVHLGNSDVSAVARPQCDAHAARDPRCPIQDLDQGQAFPSGCLFRK